MESKTLGLQLGGNEMPSQSLHHGSLGSGREISERNEKRRKREDEDGHTSLTMGKQPQEGKDCWWNRQPVNRGRSRNPNLIDQNGRDWRRVKAEKCSQSRFLVIQVGRGNDIRNGRETEEERKRGGKIYMCTLRASIRRLKNFDLSSCAMSAKSDVSNLPNANNHMSSFNHAIFEWMNE